MSVTAPTVHPRPQFPARVAIWEVGPRDGLQNETSVVPTDVKVTRDRLAVHFHDTYGQALANALAAIEAGVTTVDTSAGGLGGCPFAKSATGNLATEDLCWALAGLGIDTGVDLARLVATSAWLADRLGRPSPSRVVQALAPTPEGDHGTDGPGSVRMGDGAATPPVG